MPIKTPEKTEPQQPQPRALLIDEAKAVYRVSKSSLYRLMKSGDLPFAVAAGRRRLSVADLNRVFLPGEVRHGQ